MNKSIAIASTTLQLPVTMKRLSQNRIFTAVIMAFLLNAYISAAPLSTGDPIPKLESTDQHEMPYGITDDTKYVLVSYDMGPGKQANNYLNEKGATFLPENKAIYVANIHGMPGFVASTFALPKMRKYAHRILIMNEAGLFDEWPQEKGKVTVFTLNDAGEIESVSYWSPKSGDAPF